MLGGPLVQAEHSRSVIGCFGTVAEGDLLILRLLNVVAATTVKASDL